MLIPVSEKEFQEKVNIKFNNISHGFYRYKNKNIEGNNDSDFEKNMISFLEEAVKINGIENSYVDFYYNILSESDKERFENMIIDEDKTFIDKFKKINGNKGIYFKLTLESIPFINRLNCREILFSTIYFTKYPYTIWGNYNKSFPAFYDEDEIIIKYEELARKYKVKIE